MKRAESARDAFANNDLPSSRSVHDAAESFTTAEPGHAVDTALGVAGLWSAVEGSSASTVLLVALFFAGARGPLVARVVTIAAAAGAAASGARAAARCALEHATYKREREREEWELKNYAEGERKEVVDLWVSRGVARQDAETATGALIKTQELFVDIMMDQEVMLYKVRAYLRT
jgi:hypothetical protein